MLVGGFLRLRRDGIHGKSSSIGDGGTHAAIIAQGSVSRRYNSPSRIGGWNASPVSQGKKIQVSCDTSVMKVSTIGRPMGLA